VEEGVGNTQVEKTAVLEQGGGAGDGLAYVGEMVQDIDHGHHFIEVRGAKVIQGRAKYASFQNRCGLTNRVKGGVDPLGRPSPPRRGPQKSPAAAAHIEKSAGLPRLFEQVEDFLMDFQARRTELIVCGGIVITILEVADRRLDVFLGKGGKNQIAPVAMKVIFPGVDELGMSGRTTVGARDKIRVQKGAPRKLWSVLSDGTSPPPTGKTGTGGGETPAKSQKRLHLDSA